MESVALVVQIAQVVPLSFTSDTPPPAAVGSSYSYQFQASGTPPITFSATGLPAWAQLDPSTGLLSGTPPAPGTFNFTVTASNGIAPDATANVSLIAQLEPPTFTADTPAGSRRRFRLFLSIPGHGHRQRADHLLRDRAAGLGPAQRFNRPAYRHAAHGRNLRLQRDRQQRHRARTRP